MRKYVDLGLPSRTRWANHNEHGFHTHDKAIKLFSHRLPSKTDWDELMRHCTWTWNPNTLSYTVTGPNGKNITLPAKGFICCAGPCHAGEGHYWAAEKRTDSSTAYNLFFTDRKRFPIDDSYRVLGMSVRTVKHKS